MNKLHTVHTATAKAAAKSNGSQSHAAEAERLARQAHIEAMMDACPPIPSPARQLVAAIAQLAAFSSSLYWGLCITGWLMTAAVVYTGSAFLTFCVAVVAIFLSFRAAWRGGEFVADLILNFDSTQANNYAHELRVASARKVSVVRGWFKRNDVADPIAV